MQSVEGYTIFYAKLHSVSFCESDRHDFANKWNIQESLILWNDMYIYDPDISSCILARRIWFNFRSCVESKTSQETEESNQL